MEALEACAIIMEMVSCILPEEEVGYIALHIRAGRMDERLEESLKTVSLLGKVLAVVEEGLEISLDTRSLTYERFMAHLRYLIACVKNGASINLNMDEYARIQFLDSFRLALKACMVME